jgi:hypothetical protein
MLNTIAQGAATLLWGKRGHLHFGCVGCMQGQLMVPQRAPRRLNQMRVANPTTCFYFRHLATVAEALATTKFLKPLALSVTLSSHFSPQTLISLLSSTSHLTYLLNLSSHFSPQRYLVSSSLQAVPLILNDLIRVVANLLCSC